MVGAEDGFGPTMGLAFASTLSVPARLGLVLLLSKFAQAALPRWQYLVVSIAFVLVYHHFDFALVGDICGAMSEHACSLGLFSSV